VGGGGGAGVNYTKISNGYVYPVPLSASWSKYKKYSWGVGMCILKKYSKRYCSSGWFAGVNSIRTRQNKNTYMSMYL